MTNTKYRRADDRVGALKALRGNSIKNNFVRPECQHHHPCHSCHPCEPCGPGGAVHATTDCPECETCAGFPLFFTGPCGLVEGAVDCTGACPESMRFFPLSAQFVATAPIRVSEDGDIRFRFVSGDAEAFQVENGRIRLVFPGRYLIAYTAQIPSGAMIDTRLAVTLDNERIFASEVEVQGGHEHTHLYSGSALVDADRGDIVTLEATNGFEILGPTNIPIFTMVITRLS